MHNESLKGVHCCRWAQQSKIEVLINIFVSDNEYNTAGATKASTSLTVVSCIVVSMTAPDSKHFFLSFPYLHRYPSLECGESLLLARGTDTHTHKQLPKKTHTQKNPHTTSLVLCFCVSLFLKGTYNILLGMAYGHWTTQSIYYLLLSTKSLWRLSNQL